MASAPSASPAASRAGGYGFNWLNADAHCKALGEEELARTAKCVDGTGAFGLQSPSRACKVSANVEWMVYRTEAECREALDTMQANGP